MVKEKRPSTRTIPETVVNNKIHSTTNFIIVGDDEPPAAPFDVNSFLKKTLSNFNLVDDSSRNNDNSYHHGRQEEEFSYDDDKNKRNDEGRRVKNNHRTSFGSSLKKHCAYCGRRFNVGENNFVSSTSTTNSFLYCSDCYQLFTQNSRSEIKRRISNMADEKSTNTDTNNRGESSTLLKHHPRGFQEETTGRKKEKTHYKQHHRRHSSAPKRYRSTHSSPNRHITVVKTTSPDYYDPISSDRSNNLPSEKNNLKRHNSPATSRHNSWSSSSSTHPTCRICHLSGELGETLITPCRCSGTMQYIHTTCLVHWLEISSKKVYPSPQCELCGYHFRTHHCYRLHRLHYPQCDHRDKVLHLVFVFMVIVMIGCAALSGVYLRAEKGYRMKSSLTPEDVVVIACSVLFFCAFFVAVFTQYRAEASVCRLFSRCWLINKHWRVKDYDRNLDYERVGKSSQLADDV